MVLFMVVITEAHKKAHSRMVRRVVGPLEGANGLSSNEPLRCLIDAPGDAVLLWDVPHRR